MICIFCDEECTPTIEHIVPESLGNKHYIINSSIGTVCLSCNNRFSKFEDKALSNTFLGFERTRLAAVTKKGKPANAKVGRISISGNKDFKKNLVTFNGITKEDIKEVNRVKGEFKFVLKDSYEKQEVSISKLLLKIGYEAVFNDRSDIFNNYDFTELKKFLTAKANIDWPFILPKSGNEIYPMRNLLSPKSPNRKILDKTECRLLYCEIDEENLLLRFQYGVFAGIINLISRNTDWIERYKKAGFIDEILPKHFNK